MALGKNRHYSSLWREAPPSWWLTAGKQARKLTIGCRAVFPQIPNGGPVRYRSPEGKHGKPLGILVEWLCGKEVERL